MAEPLTVATYNVHGFAGACGRPDPERIAAVVREIDADVLALQEVVYPAAVDLAPRTLERRFPGYHCVAAPTRPHGSGLLGNAILSRLEVRAAQRFDLSRHRREPRGALQVTVDCGGADLSVVTAHFGLRHRERRHQSRSLIRLLTQPLAPFLILLGDFNDWLPGSPVIRRLQAHLGRSPRVPSYPARWPLLALDRIWVHPGSALLEVSVHRSEAARRASDHLPLVARVARP